MSNTAEKGKKPGFERGISLFRAANIGAIAVEAAFGFIAPPVAPAMKALIGFNVLMLASAEVAWQAYKSHRRRKNVKTRPTNARLRYAS